MLLRVLCVLSGLSCLTAQSVETLLLPDVLDLRPTAERLQDRLDDLTAEAAVQAGLGASGVAASIQTVVADLQSALAGGPLPLPVTVEVHVASFYEGTADAGTLLVDRPGAPVLLVVNAYESTTWTITATPATALLGVVAIGYDPQTLVVPPGTFELALSFTGNGFGDYWGQPDDPDDLQARFRAARWCIETLTLPMTTFTGGYRAPAAPFVVGPAELDWRRQLVLDAALRAGEQWNVATRAALEAAFAGAVFLPLLVPPQGAAGTPTIALANPLQVLQPLLPVPGIRGYAIGSGDRLFTLANGQPAELSLATLGTLPLPPVPVVGSGPPWNAITYDAVRDRLLVSGYGGPGALFAWSVATNQWSLLAALGDEEPAALAWHPLHDATFGVRIDTFAPSPLTLQRYDANGTLVATLPIGLPTFGEIWDSPQLYAVGPNLVFVGTGVPVLGRLIRHCFVIDPLTGDVLHAGVLLG